MKTAGYILLGIFIGMTLECWLEKVRSALMSRDRNKTIAKMAESMKGFLDVQPETDESSENTATADRKTFECEDGDQSAYEEAMAGFGRNEIS